MATKKKGHLKFPPRKATTDEIRTALNLEPEYDARIDYCDRLKYEREHGKKIITALYAYLKPGWRAGNLNHMVECEYTSRSATIDDLRRGVRETGRCYCFLCCDESDEAANDEARQVAVLLNVRRRIAEANEIPLDGTNENEAKIDKLISEANDAR